jgi:hypothetical protein
MTDAKPYINKDGEDRELDDAFFANAQTGRPPMFKSQRVLEIIESNAERNIEILAKIESDPDTWEAPPNTVPRRF